MQTTLFTTPQSSFTSARAANYLRFNIKEDGFSNNNLALLQLRKGTCLELVEKISVNTTSRLGLYYRGCLIAMVPNILNRQLLRNMERGTRYIAEVESVEKIAATPPHQLQLLLKSIQ